MQPPPPVSALPITPENEFMLRSGYTQRRKEELAVLTRWFPADKVRLCAGARCSHLLEL